MWLDARSFTGDGVGVDSVSDGGSLRFWGTVLRRNEDEERK